MYHALSSPKKQREKKRKMIFFSVSLFLFFFFLSFFAVWAFSHPSLQIQEIFITGNKVLSDNDIRKIVEKNISGKYLYLFPKTNVLFYPKKTIQNDIYTSFPRAQSVSVSLKDKTLRISLFEREAAALWCGIIEENVAAVGDSCFYMDTTGYLFDQSPNFSGNAYFKFYGKGLLRAEHPIGNDFISADLFQKIFNLRNLLEKYDKKTTKIFLGDDALAELMTESGCKIIFSTDQDILSLKSNMEAVFKSSDWGKKITGVDKCAELEYIDFRFGNKIFYKQKGIEPVPFFDAGNEEEIPEIEPVTNATTSTSTSTSDTEHLGENIPSA